MKRIGWIMITSALILLGACGSEPVATPSMDVAGLYTAAAETVIAQLTQTSEVQLPTQETATSETPAPTSATILSTNTPFITNTPIRISTPICDDAAFLSDVTIPDGYDQLAPGQQFIKTWKVKNTGTCTWSVDYKLVYGGYADQLSGQTTKIGVEVLPNATADISLTFVAPRQKGEYLSAWRLSNAYGYPFGDFLYVIIIIR